MPGEAPSIRESIASAIQSTSAAPGPDAGASQVSSPTGSEAPALSQAEPVSTLGGKEIPTGQDSGVSGKGPTRSPDGKFQAKAPADPANPVSTDAKPKSPDPAVKPEDATASAAPILPPSGWGKDVKAEWSSLPRPVQAEIEKREKDRDRALHQERNKIQVQLKNFDALSQVIQPKAREMAIAGGPAAYIGRLFALNDAANENPTGFLQWFAKQNGIDLASLAAGSQQQAPVDPTVKALQDQLARQQRVIQELGNTVRGGVQTRETEAQSAMLSTIDKWSKETEADGSPKRPYFERLEDEVLALLPRAKAANPSGSPVELLNDAYERAVYANPDTRAALEQQRETKAAAERQRKAVEAAAAARTAGAGISGSSAPNAGSVPLKSVGAELRRVAALHKGRAA
jgi:hypothetical protein